MIVRYISLIFFSAVITSATISHAHDTNADGTIRNATEDDRVGGYYAVGSCAWYSGGNQNTKGHVIYKCPGEKFAISGGCAVLGDQGPGDEDLTTSRAHSQNPELSYPVGWECHVSSHDRAVFPYVMCCDQDPLSGGGEIEGTCCIGTGAERTCSPCSFRPNPQ